MTLSKDTFRKKKENCCDYYFAKFTIYIDILKRFTATYLLLFEKKEMQLDFEADKR